MFPPQLVVGTENHLYFLDKMPDDPVHVIVSVLLQPLVLKLSINFFMFVLPCKDLSILRRKLRLNSLIQTYEAENFVKNEKKIHQIERFLKYKSDQSGYEDKCILCD